MTFERVVACQFSGRNFTENHAEGEDIRWEVELIAQKNFRRHVRVCTTEGETFALFLVSGSNACKPKVCDFETTVSGHEKVLAFEIPVYAFTGMEIG